MAVNTIYLSQIALLPWKKIKTCFLVMQPLHSCIMIFRCAWNMRKNLMIFRCAWNMRKNLLVECNLPSEWHCRSCIFCGKLHFIFSCEQQNFSLFILALFSFFYFTYFSLFFYMYYIAKIEQIGVGITVFSSKSLFCMWLFQTRLMQKLILK